MCKVEIVRYQAVHYVRNFSIFLNACHTPRDTVVTQLWTAYLEKGDCTEMLVISTI